MIKSYLKVAFRSLAKNRTFSFINIAGLAMGTLCCLYILLYVQQQYNYDKHHKDAKDIYRVTSELKISGDKHNNALTSPPIVPAMKQDFAEIMQYTRVVATINVKQHLLRVGNKMIYEKDAFFVDSTFFDVFTYHFVYGHSSNVLSEPYSIVLGLQTAEKLFGHDNPVGKTIEIDNAYGKHDFKITGVVDESLGKTHIRANLFITMNSGGIGDFVRTNDAWAGNNFTNSYVKLYPNANASLLEKKLPAFLNKYGQQQLKNLGMEKQLHLQPVISIHTTNKYELETGKTVSASFLYILLLIAILIQVIACINFMNLSTARASLRAKEVGVRKVIGAGKKDLIRQFLGESILLACVGVLFALPLLWIALPYLNQLTQADIQLSFFTGYRFWLILSGMILATGIIAGSYPAFYLSAFQAVKVIKGNFTNQVSAAGIRRSLVVFQFVLSVVLIAGIIIIYSQLNYLKNQDLGFDKDQKLVFTFYTADTKSKMKSLANDLRQLREVKAVSLANNYPSQLVFNDMNFYPPGGNMQSGVEIQFMMTDENFIAANGIQLLSGRNFRQTDSTGVLVNETAIKRLGLKTETAPGTRIYSKQDVNDPEAFSITITGVIKDFNYNSLREQVNPFMLSYNRNTDNFFIHMILSTNSPDYKSLLGKIETIWHKDLPSVPFEYAFVDDEIQKQYEAEFTLSRIINSFTLMAILISCLGLFGLAAFTAEQRRKEIGIRKVLGAGVFSLATLLSKDFLKLVVIAMVIATPIAWWAMHKWLEAFAYRVPISWWMFGAAGLIAVLIALFTVSFQAVRVAIANPVKSLRME